MARAPSEKTAKLRQVLWRKIRDRNDSVVKTSHPSCRPELTCRFCWQSGLVAFWDNHCVQHLAIHDNHQAVWRMLRTQLRGDVVR